MTRVWDRTLGEERSLLYVPAFPIAQWLVENWWTLLNEPLPPAGLPKVTSAHFAWVKRHCLRSAESGLLLPALYLFNDGRSIAVEWQSDDPDVSRNMPGEFGDSGVDHLDKGQIENALAEFISEVLHRIDGLDDERVDQLRENWRAIQSADVEETSFCVLAGRMGVDPYDPSRIPGDLGAFLENAIRDPDLPLVRDLTEAAQPQWVSSQWEWVQRATEQWGLGPLAGRELFPVEDGAQSPSSHGYRLAMIVRQRAGLAPSAPVPSIADVTRTAVDVPFRAPEQNHVPGSGIRAAVGWNDDNEIVVAGPHPQRASSQRFLEARGLYHALYACGRSERLVTDAYTWDQQASRAFAAELLAPRVALSARTGSRADRSRLEELAESFGASTIVIEKQLENTGVVIVDE